MKIILLRIFKPRENKTMKKDVGCQSMNALRGLVPNSVSLISGIICKRYQKTSVSVLLETHCSCNVFLCKMPSGKWPPKLHTDDQLKHCSNLRCICDCKGGGPGVAHDSPPLPSPLPPLPGYGCKMSPVLRLTMVHCYQQI